MSRKNAVSTVSLTDGTLLTFAVANVGEFAVDVSTLAEPIRQRAMFHGIVQKIQDAAALSKGATPGDKFAAMSAVAERLSDGDWSKRKGEGGGTPAGIIFRAYFEYVSAVAKKRKLDAPTEERAREIYAAKSRSDQLALRTVPEIYAIIERMKSEQPSTAKVDVDALLGELF